MIVASVKVESDEYSREPAIIPVEAHVITSAPRERVTSISSNEDPRSISFPLPNNRYGSVADRTDYVRLRARAGDSIEAGSVRLFK
jgi:hypothetical protein